MIRLLSKPWPPGFFLALVSGIGGVWILLVLLFFLTDVQPAGMKQQFARADPGKVMFEREILDEGFLRQEFFEQDAEVCELHRFCFGGEFQSEVASLPIRWNGKDEKVLPSLAVKIRLEQVFGGSRSWRSARRCRLQAGCGCPAGSSQTSPQSSRAAGS